MIVTENIYLCEYRLVLNEVLRHPCLPKKRNKQLYFAMTNSRERILSRIHTALQTPIEDAIVRPILSHSPFKAPEDDSMEVCFAKKFQKNGGNFFFCQNLEEFLAIFKKWLAYQKIHILFAPESYLQTLLKLALIDYEVEDTHWRQAQASIMTAEKLVAETGSIIISSKRASGRRWITFPPVQIIVAFTSQLTNSWAEALQTYKLKHQNDLPSMISVITSPSQTADIERTLVMGAHGAEKLALFLIDENVIDE